MGHIRRCIEAPLGTFSGQYPGQSAVVIPEHAHRDELARRVNGATEAALPFGRVDVLTSAVAFEVKPWGLWKRAVRQALTYAAQTGCRPAVALFGEATPTEVLAIYLTLRDARPPVDLWWLGRGGWERVTGRSACRAMPSAPMAGTHERGSERLK